MRTTIIYLVDVDDQAGNELAAPTLDEARRWAREEAERGGRESEIRRTVVPLVPSREAVCNLFNRERFVLESEAVETYVPENVIDDYWSPEGPRWSYRVEGRE